MFLQSRALEYSMEAGWPAFGCHGLHRHVEGGRELTLVCVCVSL